MAEVSLNAVTNIPNKTVTDDVLDAIMDGMKRYHAVTGVSANGMLDILFTLDDTDERNAIQDGVKVVSPVLSSVGADLTDIGVYYFDEDGEFAGASDDWMLFRQVNSENTKRL